MVDLWTTVFHAIICVCEKNHNILYILQPTESMYNKKHMLCNMYLCVYPAIVLSPTENIPLQDQMT